MLYSYRSQLIDLLLRHGISPKSTTRPALIREFLNSLYVIEIRELRRKRRELESFFGAQPLATYSDEVLDLKQRYEILSIPIDRWVELEQSEGQVQRALASSRSLPE